MSIPFRRILPGFIITMLVLGLSGPRCLGQSWRAAQDTNGWSWARVTFVNQSTNTSDWTVWNCRTALSSSAATATTDPVLNWNGVVGAGQTQTVWVYVMDSFSDNAHIGNGDGGVSTYLGAYTPSLSGDSEWVITIATDATVSATLSPGATYAAPAHTGN